MTRQLHKLNTQSVQSLLIYLQPTEMEQVFTASSDIFEISFLGDYFSDANLHG